MKKADLSINVIIMAVIGLIVLIVLVMLFTGKVRFFSRHVAGSCTDQGGTCQQAMPGGFCDMDKPIKIWIKGCPCVVEESNPDACSDEKGEGQCCLPIVR
jgi:hypothetical protein